MTQSAHEDQFIAADQATGCSVAADPTQERTGNTAAEQAAYWRGFEEAQLNAQHNARVRDAASTVADEGAEDELATYSLQPVATAFFTEKGEVAYTGIYDRTLKALESVKTTRMGISAGSIDLYHRPVSAPAAGDARDAARLDWLEQHDGRFYNKDRISSIVGTGFLIAGDEHGVRHQTVRAAIDAALSASQQGGE
jgi:hypothetical protein